MKKSFALVTLLAVIAIGGTCLVSAALLEEKDNVQITETVVYGDKSIVEGVTIERNVKYDNFIRWNTTYVVGEEPDCKTDYTFDEYGRLLDEGTYQYSGIELHTNPIVNFDDEEEALELVGLNKAMKELLDETAPGEENSMIINLADYLDYYVYEVHIQLPGDINYFFLNGSDIEEAFIRYNGNDSYLQELEEELHIVQRMTEFFKIPVLENHFYEISVSKDMEGNLFGWGYGNANGGGSSGNVTIHGVPEEADSFDLWMISAYADGMCYFTFNPRTMDDKIVDTSYIPGGFGIYSMPFDEEERTIDVDSLKMVYALKPEEEIFDLDFDKEKNQLVLFTIKEEGCAMTVIDAASMKLKQEILYSTEGFDSHGCYYGEDYMVLRYKWDKGMLLSIDENGSYQIEYGLDFAEITENEYFDMERVAFDWNGETLIMSGALYDGSYYYYEDCGIYLAAFDRTGLVYHGKYESSLDTGRSYEDYYYNCMPTDTDALKISW